VGYPGPAVSTRFDRDTAVRLVESSSAGPSLYEGRIDRGWWVVRGPNGGYVAALVLRALAANVEPERAVRSLTLHYTAPPEEGPVQIETRVERAGRSLTTVSGRLRQGDRLLALALAAFSKSHEGMAFDHARMPEVPPPEACHPFGGRMPIHERYESRWAIGDPPFSGSSQALAGGWIRSAEPRRADAPLVAAFTDAWPPAAFSLATDRSAVESVPTVDLTVHFRSELPLASAAPDDFQLVVFRSRLAAQGFVEEDGEVWSREGRLLAQSRQLALLR
jgi:acyl-CoA thioesterase